jgi:hypothetical protein
MKHVIEMSSGAMIYKFHKDWLRHSKVHKGDTQTHTLHGDRISLLFLQNKESRLKIKVGL